jgi:hypothetical protein
VRTKNDTNFIFIPLTWWPRDIPKQLSILVQVAPQSVAHFRNSKENEDKTAVARHLWRRKDTSPGMSMTNKHVIKTSYSARRAGI